MRLRKQRQIRPPTEGVVIVHEDTIPQEDHKLISYNLDCPCKPKFLVISTQEEMYG